MNPTRRSFITGSLATLARPWRVDADQPSKVYRVGALSELPRYAPTEQRWREALRGHGYIEGQNIVFELRWGDGTAETLKAHAAELVKLNVDLILTTGHVAAVPAKQTTQVSRL